VVPPKRNQVCIDKGSKLRKKKARKIILNSGWKVNIGGASLNMEQTSGKIVEEKQVHSAAEEQLVVMLSLMLLAAEDSAAAAEAAMRFAAVES